ncbi:MAG: LysR family transcriptional regulator [Oscillospiraceae bacterium]|nr:LysR family transcriptional regulator [Oscillospiraceae bacterium]
MTLYQLIYFIEIAHCRSFSRAAERLYVTQPHLTKSIASLERELDMKLLDRSTHHVRLTPDGTDLLERIERHAVALQNGIEQTKISSKNHMHKVIIGISRDETIPAELLELVCEMNAENEGYRYFLEQNTYVELISRLRGGEYKLAVTTDRNMRTAVGIDHLILRPFEMVLALPKNHPMAHKADLKPTDFGSEPVFFAVPETQRCAERAL